MIAAWPLEVENVRDRRVPEPRKVLEGDEDLPVAEENPKAVRRDVFNGRLKSGVSKPVGFRAHGVRLPPEFYQAPAGTTRNSPRARFWARPRTSLPPERRKTRETARREGSWGSTRPRH